MHTLKVGLETFTPFDAAIWAVACVAFWACCHLGEVLVPRVDTFDPIKYVLCGPTKTTFYKSPSSVHLASFHIPWTKTTQTMNTNIVVTELNDPTCPFTTLCNYLAVNSDVPPGALYFSLSIGILGCSPLTCDWFLDCCKNIWQAASLTMQHGHAFCIGGATKLLLHTTHSDIVAMQGHWKLKSFLEYWCCIEGILPLFITNSFTSDRACLASCTMESYSWLHHSSTAL